MINLVSPGTGHVIDPVTHGEQMRRIADYAAKGIDQFPKHLRFVTWTLKYGRCHWLQVLGLGEHYTRAELEATVDDDGGVDVAEPKNITRFAILYPMSQSPTPRLRVGGQVVPLPVLDQSAGPRQSVIGKRDGRWAYLGELGAVNLVGKRPGVQGPIDDAFVTPFLCVRGTGQPWNPTVQAWADASLKRFANEWNRYFRGELPVKNDTDVTIQDVRRSNLILFGDPGSNRWIAKVLPNLPLNWTKKELVFGGAKYSAADHAVLLIHPNPLAADRYVVLNSGHTFGERELASLNYLLFPRLGDWAVLKVPSREVVCAGFFDEQWHVADRPVR